MQNGLNSPGPFTIFLVFSAGLLTSLGPCSLSLLPVTIAYIGGTEKNKFKLISFSGGVVFSLVALGACLLYTSPSPRDGLLSRMPSSA